MRLALLTVVFVLFTGAAQASPALDLAEESGAQFRLPFVGSVTAYGPYVGLEGAGNFNGDGLADLVMLNSYARAEDAGGRPSVAYLLLGKGDLRAAPGVLTPRDTLRIAPEEGWRLSHLLPAGDVNGDGLDDLLATSWRFTQDDFYQPDGAPSTVLVLGTPTPQDIDLGVLRAAGLEVHDGFVYGGVGDVNRDGFDDISVPGDGAPSFEGPSLLGGPQEDKVRVLFGSANPDQVGSSGFTIEKADDDYGIGKVAAAGDVNGDGTSDVLVGITAVIVDELINKGSNDTTYLEDGRRLERGGAVVVFGGDRAGQTVNVGQLSSDGFRIHGLPGAEGSSRRATGVGDMNGDGFADVAFDAKDSSSYSYSNPYPRFYVIYGGSQPADVDVRSLGDRGFGMKPPPNPGSSHQLQYDLAAADDLNGDGRSDLLIGVGGDLGYSLESQLRSSYVVYGAEQGDEVELKALRGPGDNPIGYKLRGLPADRGGFGVAAPGDMDGDGSAELAILAMGCIGVDTTFADDVDALPIVYLPDADARAKRRGRSTQGDDTLQLGADDIRQRGRGGNDTLIGTDDPNCLYGDDWDDRLEGKGGGDVLHAGIGNDTVLGGEGKDLLQGRPGDDSLSGGPGDDYVTGGSGADDLDGGEGTDSIWGRAGDDTIQDHQGTDTVHAGDGDDRIDVADGDRDEVRCGFGEDTVVVDALDEVITRRKQVCEHVERSDPSA